jgi:hypothetical protein
MSTQPGDPAAPNETTPARPVSALGSDSVTAAMRLQILTAEHSSLVATRSLAWNEAFTRVGTYLALLSGAIVALALVGQNARFGDAFFVFGLVILPVVLFVGVTTFVRVGSSNYHDAQCVIGMNRIRAGYLEIAPDLAPFFVMGVHDDPAGVSQTMSFEPGAPLLLQLLSASPSVVAVVNSVLVGAILSFAMLLLGIQAAAVLAVAILASVVSFITHSAYARRRVRQLQTSIQPVFPSPPNA